eukprot:4051400-Pyramimonas_sp.AAC.1
MSRQERVSTVICGGELQRGWVDSAPPRYVPTASSMGTFVVPWWSSGSSYRLPPPLPLPSPSSSTLVRS